MVSTPTVSLPSDSATGVGDEGEKTQEQEPIPIPKPNPLHHLTTKLTTYAAKYATHITTLTHRLQRTLSKTTNLSTQLTAHQNEIKALKRKVADLENELEDERGKRRRLEGELDVAGREVADVVTRFEVVDLTGVEEFVGDGDGVGFGEEEEEVKEEKNRLVDEQVGIGMVCEDHVKDEMRIETMVEIPTVQEEIILPYTKPVAVSESKEEEEDGGITTSTSSSDESSSSSDSSETGTDRPGSPDYIQIPKVSGTPSVDGDGNLSDDEAEGKAERGIDESGMEVINEIETQAEQAEQQMEIDKDQESTTILLFESEDMTDKPAPPMPKPSPPTHKTPSRPPSPLTKTYTIKPTNGTPPPPPPPQIQPLPAEVIQKWPRRPEGDEKDTFIGVTLENIPFRVGEEELRELIEKEIERDGEGTGKVVSVRVVREKKTGRSYGCAYVDFDSYKTANRFSLLRTFTLSNRIVRITPYKTTTTNPFPHLDKTKTTTDLLTRKKKKKPRRELPLQQQQREGGGGEGAWIMNLGSTEHDIQTSDRPALFFSAPISAVQTTDTLFLHLPPQCKKPGTILWLLGNATTYTIPPKKTHLQPEDIIDIPSLVRATVTETDRENTSYCRVTHGRSLANSKGEREELVESRFGNEVFDAVRESVLRRVPRWVSANGEEELRREWREWKGVGIRCRRA